MLDRYLLLLGEQEGEKVSQRVCVGCGMRVCSVCRSMSAEAGEAACSIHDFR